MPIKELIIEGARQNNLKNISLRLPHNKVISITGLSGSGKSSLAFDTIFAEGQWRFIESLSTYARLFLEKLDRPDVDAIYNIRPAIALEQKNPVKGSRSTVGTLTEIYDLLRVLYSKISTPICPRCNKEIKKWDPSQIVSNLKENYLNERAIILFPSEDTLDTLKQKGFHRIWFNQQVIDISDLEHVNQYTNDHKQFHVVLDRLIIRDEPRLADSIEMAWREGKKKIKVILIQRDGDTNRLRELKFSSKNSCDDCEIELPDPTPILFSFNHPVCACPKCNGFGNILTYNEDLIIPDKYLSLSEGAIEMWERPSTKWWKNQLIRGAKKSHINTEIPYCELTNRERELIFKGNEHFYGINDFFEELENKRYKLHVRVFLSRYRSPITCPLCKGRRLCEKALFYKIEGLNIAELCDMPISDLLNWFKSLHLSPMERDIAKDILKQIISKLQFMIRVGLDYLTLSRQTKTLSGGEYQRLNLANQLGQALTGTLYVLDEPTIGLHPRDTRRIADIMKELSSLGNTIIVVEHDYDVISSSDWVVELGPGGGHLGGEVVFSGTIDEFLKTNSLTATYIKRRKSMPERPNRDDFKNQNYKNFLSLYNASGNNLKNINLKIPLKTLTAITGVSGSGKSSLIIETLYKALSRHFKINTEQPLPYEKLEGVENIKGVSLIDQTPIGKTPRSNPLTYLKIFDSIRKIFSQQPESKAHGYTPAFFSFNIPGGRCETCKGEGYQKMEMYFFEDIFVKCEECNGRRYKDDALKVTYKGKNISDILDMTVDEAYDFFREYEEIKTKIKLMKDIGLGYLRLGQPATTLSGGESQRLKICLELSSSRLNRSNSFLYILDEPTVGLHPHDVFMFMKIIRMLVNAGNTVLIIEHNLDVISQADWVIDLGPEGGEKGGNIIFEGTPEDLIKHRESYTGEYLRRYLNQP